MESVVGIALVAALGFAPTWWSIVTLAAAALGYAPMLLDLWRYRHVPGPLPVPVIGTMWRTGGQNLHRTYLALERKYGRVFKLFYANKCVIVVFDVDSIREIGLRKFSCFTNRPAAPPKMMAVLSEKERQPQIHGMLFARDAYWKGIRSTAHSILHNVEQLSSFCPLMKETAEELADRLDKVKEGEPIDIWRAFGDMTLDVVGSTIFGVRFNCVQSKGADAVKAARIIFREAGLFGGSNPYLTLSFISPEFIIPVLKFFATRFPTQGMEKTKWARTYLNSISEEMYRLARQESAAGVADAPAGSNTTAAKADTYEYNGNSFLKLFIQGHNRETGQMFTKEEVLPQAFIFLLAGYETTANTLGYAIYLLAKNKDKERALIDEIDRLGEGKSDLPTVEELKSYEYLDAVLSEVLRITGPATLLVREASKDVVVGGHQLSKGTAVHMDIHGMHQNPEYFPDPDKFLPERFVKGSNLYDKQNHKAHMPFGLGPRMCVASNFALVEAKLALITLFKRYRFDHNPHHKYATRMGVTLGPVNGIEVLVHKRK